MSDFERLYLVIMIISLVLAAIQIGRDGKDKKENTSRHPTLTGRRLSILQRGKLHHKRHPFLSLL